MFITATKFLKQKCDFSDFFLSRWWPGGTLTDIIICKRHQSSTRQTESIRHRAGCRQRNEQFVILILTRFSLCTDKEIYVVTDPKGGQNKHYYQRKKTVTLSIGSGQKEFLMAQRNQHLSFKYMEFVLTRYHFCNWCFSPRLLRLLSSRLNRSFWNSFFRNRRKR